MILIVAVGNIALAVTVLVLQMRSVVRNFGQYGMYLLVDLLFTMAEFVDLAIELFTAPFMPWIYYQDLWKYIHETINTLRTPSAPGTESAQRALYAYLYCMYVSMVYAFIYTLVFKTPFGITVLYAMIIGVLSTIIFELHAGFRDAVWEWMR